uniref:Histone acetyltransferase n=1 Tax=Hemiselmis andersenii TaxID=464988 RepID=A0A7S1HGA4_HEMAN|mmetsp:Transcript_58188/g.140293  ORF Transcript_58188/g.140293 Transcript_58188/m.140293 type:complete len:372 (+) Transcript_58188:433-1548(+)
MRECEIIEKRMSEGKVEAYYVHWSDFNRRCDSWVPIADVDLNTTKDKLKEIRDLKRNFDEFAHDHDEHEGMDEATLRHHNMVTKIKNVNKIQIGQYLVEVWYYSPLPKSVWRSGDEVIDILYFCEFTLNFYRTKEELERHQKKGCLRHPPGDEIYRNDKVSVFEVDGSRSKQWCQNLCYLAKMFLDHKTLWYDTDSFFFYVICECDEQGYHVVGYFSKEKESEEDYNLACILTLPQHQRKGYGKFIISFSYELSKIEGKAGSPEKPLSDLGKEAYHSHWNRELLHTLKKIGSEPNPDDRFVSLQKLSEMTSFKRDDIEATLKRLQMINYYKSQAYVNVNPTLVNYHISKCGGSGVRVDPTKIHWTPHINPS